jgi:hypothetical protein
MEQFLLFAADGDVSGRKDARHHFIPWRRLPEPFRRPKAHLIRNPQNPL